jgi:hypothetical protein
LTKTTYELLQNITTPQLTLNRFAYLYLRVSRDSKWWNSNLIINWALLILFVLFPIVEIYRLLKVWVRRRNFIHHSLRYRVHNLSPPEYKTDFFFLRKTRTFPNLSHSLKYSSCSRLAKNVKFHSFLLGLKVKMLNTLSPLAPI